MGLREYPKDDLINGVKALVGNNVEKVPAIFKEYLLYLEYMHYVDILENIKKRKDKLPLFKPNEYVNFYIPNEKRTTDVAKGCQSCLMNKITHIRHSDQCNQECEFCYFIGIDPMKYFIPNWAYQESSTRFNLDENEMKLLLEKQILIKVTSIG